MCVQPTVYGCVISLYLCACVFSTHCLHHSFLSLSFFPPLSRPFSQSLPPCFDLSLLFSPTRSQSQKHAHAHAPIFPPTHAVGTGESPTGSTVWRRAMQRNTKIGAAPLPNGVSMATKGARPCDAVSSKHRVLNLSKEISLCSGGLGMGSIKKQK